MSERTTSKLECGCIVTTKFGHLHTKLCTEHFTLSFEDSRALRRERAQTITDPKLREVAQLIITQNGDLI